jgi:hypothetical protein
MRNFHQTHRYLTYSRSLLAEFWPQLWRPIGIVWRADVRSMRNSGCTKICLCEPLITDKNNGWSFYNLKGERDCLIRIVKIIHDGLIPLFLRRRLIRVLRSD